MNKMTETKRRQWHWAEPEDPNDEALCCCDDGTHEGWGFWFTEFGPDYLNALEACAAALEQEHWPACSDNVRRLMIEAGKGDCLQCAALAALKEARDE